MGEVSEVESCRAEEVEERAGVEGVGVGVEPALRLDGGDGDGEAEGKVSPEDADWAVVMEKSAIKQRDSKNEMVVILEVLAG